MPPTSILSDGIGIAENVILGPSSPRVLLADQSPVPASTGETP